MCLMVPSMVDSKAVVVEGVCVTIGILVLLVVIDWRWLWGCMEGDKGLVMRCRTLWRVSLRGDVICFLEDMIWFDDPSMSRSICLVH